MQHFPGTWTWIWNLDLDLDLGPDLDLDLGPWTWTLDLGLGSWTWTWTWIGALFPPFCWHAKSGKLAINPACLLWSVSCSFQNLSRGIFSSISYLYKLVLNWRLKRSFLTAAVVSLLQAQLLEAVIRSCCDELYVLFERSTLLSPSLSEGKIQLQCHLRMTLPLFRMVD